MQASWNEQEIADLGQKLSGLTASMSQVIVGQKDVIDSLVICLIAGGHALLEGVLASVKPCSSNLWRKRPICNLDGCNSRLT